MVLCGKICKLFLLPDRQWSDVLNIFRGSIPLSYHNSYSIYFRSIQMPWAKPHPHQSVQNDLCLTYLQLNYKGNSYMVLYDYIIHYDPRGKWSLQGVVCVGEPVFFEFPIRRLICKPACRSVVCFCPGIGSILTLGQSMCWKREYWIIYSYLFHHLTSGSNREWPDHATNWSLLLSNQNEEGD